MTFHILRPVALAVLVVASACTQDTVAPAHASFLADTSTDAPPDACWETIVEPAVIETVTDQRIVQPAEVASDGSVARPAIYRTRTRQAIVRARSETRFEKVCDAALTPDFVAVLQRALAARTYYRGAINGRMDPRTQAAIRKYQSDKGLDSDVLAIASAQRMGLVPTAEIDG